MGKWGNCTGYWIVIPKEARNHYDLVAGTRLIVLGDEQGIALISAEKFEENIKKAMELISIQVDS